MLTFDRGKNRFNYRTVGLCIHDHHVLLHQMEGDDYWALPGGRVEMLENSKDALEREMKEELGDKVKVQRLLWVMETFFQHETRHFHELGFYYLFSLPESFPYLDKTESFHGAEEDVPLVFKWFPLSEIRKDFSLHPIFLRKAIHDLPTETVHVIQHD
ncbi:MAG TPA: NUDIX hydrolase [Bacillales bacterium]|nr:NUDIX hydrolase [Bacillales bacterium]